MSDPQAVTEMFDDISSHYDFLNHLLSFGADRRWRRKTSQRVAKHHPTAILDVATGTADLAIRLAKDNPQADIKGIDLSEKMLNIGKAKVTKEKLAQRIQLQQGDAQRLPYSDDSFDAVTVAFGVRNFSKLEKGLQEIVRVAKGGGHIAILEFSHPNAWWIKMPYRFYSRHILPFIGRGVSKNKDAYSYLPSSIQAFPDKESFINTLNNNGLSGIQTKSFFGGIAILYLGEIQKKPLASQ